MNFQLISCAISSPNPNMRPLINGNIRFIEQEPANDKILPNGIPAEEEELVALSCVETFEALEMVLSKMSDGLSSSCSCGCVSTPEKATGSGFTILRISSGISLITSSAMSVSVMSTPLVDVMRKRCWSKTRCGFNRTVWNVQK